MRLKPLILMEIWFSPKIAILVAYPALIKKLIMDVTSVRVKIEDRIV